MNWSRVSVLCLFLHGRPPAIARLIVPVVIDTVNRLALGPFAHIGKEVAEVTSPSLAHGDSSAAVARIRLVVRPVTATKHRAVAAIGRGLCVRSLVAMLRDSGRGVSRSMTTQAQPMQITKALPVMASTATKNRTNGSHATHRQEASGVRVTILGDDNVQRVAVLPPAVVVELTPSTGDFSRAGAAFNRAGFVTLGVHRELILSVAMRPDVAASRPLFVPSILPDRSVT